MAGANRRTQPSRYMVFFVVLTATLALATFAFVPLAARAAGMTADTDRDGTLDLAEVRAAAISAFESLNTDKDTTLDLKEVARHFDRRFFATADTDNDKTLSEDEYLSIVVQLFNDADQDHDGTLDANELRSKAGRALQRLLK